MKKLLVAAMMALVAGTAFADGAAKKAPAKADAQAVNAPMSQALLKVGGKEIVVLVAETEAQRKRGLMDTEELPDNIGMFFIYDQEASKACMWMKNTKIPLSVAFIDKYGTIVNIEEMKPLTEDNHCNTAPVKFALEMNGGWFERNGVKPGDSISN